MIGNGAKSEIVMYTDGACSVNPGRGGYGVLLKYGEHRLELSGGFRKTTNNRMELLAVIEGLNALKWRCEVTVYSDSKLTVDAVSKGWLRRWQANDWQTNGWKANGRRAKPPSKVMNRDLWEQLIVLLDTHNVTMRWVKGHAGNPGNERADALAVAAANGRNLGVDAAYESQAGRLL